jgi:hypothetical protein
MRKLIFTAASIAVAAATMALATPAQAARPNDWCSRAQSHLHCMYHTHAQCRASVSGRGVRNPRSMG